MSDLIEREKAIEAIKRNVKENFDYYMAMECYTDEDAIEAINSVPSAEVSKRTVKVEWYPGLTTFTDGICECGERVRDDWKYCPGCGAKLEWK